MNKKIIAFSSIVVLLAFGFLYINSGNLSANNKNDSTTKKCCVDQSTSSTKKEIKAGGDQFSKYEFTTDKACCNEMKSSMQKEIMGAGGVKDVKFSETCTASKMTMVTVYYSAGETNETQIASFLKDKNFDCPMSPDCNHEGCKDKMSGKEKSGGKMECPKGGCDQKNKKTEGKDI
jgi:hypothetical protein